MKTIRNENVVYCDVDETLIDWSNNDKDIKVNYYGQTVYVKAIKENIRFLKSLKARGAFIIVHTGNGFQWAEEIVKKLKLTKYVDLTMTKPAKYIDDKDFDTFAKRINLRNDNN